MVSESKPVYHKAESVTNSTIKDNTEGFEPIQNEYPHIIHDSATDSDNPGLWGGWQFQVTQRDELANGTIGLQFGYGGYQEARGSGVSNQHLYVENVLEELDSPGEWCVQTALHVCFFSHACFFVCLLI